VDKRYQVFVSSTYADLKEERRAVIQTVIESNCIPAGMELFPAADEQQLDFIKRVINDCDYYLLIIGGRYGSVDETGASYTEREYDYAVGRGLWVIALLHENPSKISLEHSEPEAAGREKLQKFRDKVSKGRLVKFWKSAAELPGLVSMNLAHAMNAHPAVGWVRANGVASEKILGEINEVRKRNAEIQTLLQSATAALEHLKSPPLIKNLAGLDEEIEVPCHYTLRNGKRYFCAKTTWRKLFASVSPFLEKYPNEDEVGKILAHSLFVDEQRTYGGYGPHLDDQSFQTVAVQLKALGLVKIAYSSPPSGRSGLWLAGAGIWSLTPKGEKLMLERRTVRAKTTTPTVK
jgi:hypothetical protein